MKALFVKELREQFKVALLGLLIFAALLFFGYRETTEALLQMINGGYVGNNSLQPLLSMTVLSATAIFCAIFGALLGWLQIRAEKHGDLWAFLIHRPITRTRIFAAKLLAGLCLYSLAAGLPMLALVILVWTPGHVATPFEWAMVLPCVTLFLCGILCYFAGMLTGLRQARRPFGRL